MKLAGRTAVITGASQGLGAEIARQFVAEGASVMLCARTSGDLEATADSLRSSSANGVKILTASCDVGDTQAVDDLITAATDEFGRIDALVNNAGIYGPFGTIDEVNWQEWVDAIRINLMGTVYPCRAVLGRMRAQGYGKIINLSGGGATNPLPRISAYAASKAAVVRFTETLALELAGTGIDINAIAPGALNTRMMQQLLAAGPEAVGEGFHRRMSEISQSKSTPPEKGAALCVYLASAESDGISGKLLSAVWDPWPSLQDHRADLDGSDVYTIRRIVPGDRRRKPGHSSRG
jgi:3-oxoacyl-[acyl-carrier protein] reductase